MNRRHLFPMATDKETRRVWPEIINLFLALTVSGIAIWAQPNPWLTVLLVILTVIAVAMLVRDSGVLAWWRKTVLSIKANRIAKREYPRFVKMFERARIHQELIRELRNLDWKVSPVPHFANMRFENWYSDILGSISRLKVRRATELELLGNRFHDLLSVMNTDYFRPFSEALRQGHAQYRNEQAMKSARAAKDMYDRFLETYNVFCDEINEAAQRRILISAYNTPSAFDWDAAVPQTEKQ